MELKIKLIKSAFYEEEKTRKRLAEFVVTTPFFSMGSECRRFEESFAEKQGRKFAVFVTSGSAANLVLVQAYLNLGRLKKGDKVGFSVLTWPTNVMPLIQLGLVPVPLDCSLSTLNVSPSELMKCDNDLKALFLTNSLGFSDDIISIKKICEERNILFFEDNCESLGSKVGNAYLGNFGGASTFSFFVGHHMSTIEGGMICTDDEKLYDSLLMTRIHGWDRNLSPEKQKALRESNGIDDFYAKYTFYDLAFNARPTEINGFLGNIQLPYLDEIISKRERNFKMFNDAASRNDDFFLLDVSHMNLVSNFAYPVICKDADGAAAYKQKFMESGVEVRPVIAGDITKQLFYKKYNDSCYECKNSDFIHKNGFYFGNNPEMTDEELKILCDLLLK